MAEKIVTDASHHRYRAGALATRDEAWRRVVPRPTGVLGFVFKQGVVPRADGSLREGTNPGTSVRVTRQTSESQR